MTNYDHDSSHPQGVAMRTVSFAEAKARLSELLNSGESGEDILITQHGRAIARVSAPEMPKQLWIQDPGCCLGGPFHVG